MPLPQVHFVTGRLAEPIVRAVTAKLAQNAEWEPTVHVLPISVAALMTTEWIARQLLIPPGAARVILPGYCGGDLDLLRSAWGCAVELGPKDARELGRCFGRASPPPDLCCWDVEIIAEINHAPRLSLDELATQARRLVDDGADVIDLGCDPGTRWIKVGDAVRSLVEQGLRVSIDSFDAAEVQAAVDAGAELVLSVNSSNCAAALDWGCEVVVIPDQPADLESLFRTGRWLVDRGVRVRLDSILEPIGTGLAASLIRYARVREEWPEAAILMGIGNLTELTDVDSAGINMMLAAVCQEWSIGSVLTTQVINWARSCVREFDVARRLARFAQTQQAPPKHVDHRLIMLRDPEILEYTEAELAAMARQIKDRNYRLFVARGDLFVLGAGRCWRGADAFELFDEVFAAHPESMDPSHAFYLGFELCKAEIARLLNKNYRQDEALRWGMLTQHEPERHRLRRRRPRGGRAAEEPESNQPDELRDES